MPDEKDTARELVQQLREANAISRQTFEQHVEAIANASRLLKARFDTLVEAGFEPGQALEIIKARGLN